MQLFGLVNALLERDPQTRKHDLKIQRYAICPLSHDAGIVGWVPNTDTLHSVIRDYRQSKKIPLNMENLEMLKIAPDYDLLTVMQKVEVFVEALKKTTGQGNDLYEILWLKSTNSEEWLERRTRYARSLAVMSMVGYILGLGDRHPSNLMLDKLTGRVLHIDLGDCFEVAMNREKFPEKVPFRLTRMLIRAMEVSGIEGSYRSTCERTLNVLRDSKDSLVAMLEAFVYDPLISWRLADISESNLSGDRLRERPVNNPFAPVERHVDGVPIEVAGRNNVYVNPISEGREEDEDDAEDDRDEILNDANDEELLASAPSHRPTARDLAASRARSLQMHSEIQALAANVNMDARIASIAGDRSDRILAGVVEGSQARSRMERSMRQREYMSTLGGEEGAAREETLNQKALKVIRRVEDKLTGTDFSDCDDKPLDVADQVQRLIVQATSIENLCQLYIGWCSFW
jgi:phosphatidylinositol kinase/protein kinase (PI-3  family)